MDDKTWFDGRVVEMSGSFHADQRGTLSAFEFARLGFMPVRSFIIAAPDGTERGGHGHRTGRQLLVCTSGRVELELSYAGETIHLTLDGPDRAVLISAPVWARQTYRGDRPVLMVLSDVPFADDVYLVEPQQ